MKREIKKKNYKKYLVVFIFLGILIFIPYFVGGDFPDTGVVSVEKFSLTLTATVSSAHAPFTKGQNSSNTVPFVTKYMQSSGAAEDWQHHLTRVTFNSTDVIIDRVGTSALITIEITVVEFDPSSVKVQSGSYTMADGDISTTSPISDSVNTSRTALIFYSKITGTIDDDYNSASVKGNFWNSTVVSFVRQDTTGTITGTWYVFESLDGAFTVQSKLLTVPNGAETATVGIDSVQMNKTFLIASYGATENSDNARDGSTSVVLTSSTLITATRGGSVAGDSIFLNIFVITFTGNEYVQRGTLSFTDSASAPESVTATINSVNTSNSMAWNPVLTGRMSSDGTGEGDLQSAFSRLDFPNSTAIRGTRGLTGGTTIASYEVVEWVVQSGEDSTPPVILSPPDQTLEYRDDPLYADFNATDAGGVGNWSINWTSNFSIVALTGILTNSSILPIGEFYINVSVNDTTGNLNSTIYNVNVSDATAPVVTITSPTNNTNTTDTGLDILYTYIEFFCDSAGWDDGTTNRSLGCGTNITNITWSEGNHNISIWVNDTSNNLGNNYVSFLIDTTPPTFTDFANQTIQNDESLSYDINATDIGAGLGNFSINWTTTFNIVGITGVLTNTSALSVQEYYINVSVNDTLGNTNSDILLINVTLAPTDTCTCTGAGNDWEIDMSDYCNITIACDLTTGVLNFTGVGVTRCDAEIKTSDFRGPESGLLEILDDCLIYES